MIVIIIINLNGLFDDKPIRVQCNTNNDRLASLYIAAAATATSISR